MYDSFNREVYDVFNYVAAQEDEKCALGAGSIARELTGL